jgi:uncharacterized protein YbjQ (UPF0145 family)
MANILAAVVLFLLGIVAGYVVGTRQAGSMRRKMARMRKKMVQKIGRYRRKADRAGDKAIKEWVKDFGCWSCKEQYAGYGDDAMDDRV